MSGRGAKGRVRTTGSFPILNAQKSLLPFKAAPTPERNSHYIFKP